MTRFVATTSLLLLRYCDDETAVEAWLRVCYEQCYGHGYEPAMRLLHVEAGGWTTAKAALGYWLIIESIVNYESRLRSLVSNWIICQSTGYWANERSLINESKVWQLTGGYWSIIHREDDQGQSFGCSGWIDELKIQCTSDSPCAFQLLMRRIFVFCPPFLSLASFRSPQRYWLVYLMVSFA